MIRRHRVHRDIFNQVWAALRVHAEPSQELAASDLDVRRVPENPSELVRRLAETFNEHDLISAGIAVRSDSGGLVAAPRLKPGAGPVLGLFPEDGAAPFDLLFPDGLLNGNELPLYALAHDHRFQAVLRSSRGPAFLVPTIEDVASCFALGLAAAPTTGLEHLRRAQFRSIEELTANRTNPPLPPTPNIAVPATAQDEVPPESLSDAAHHDALADGAHANADQQGDELGGVDQIDLPQGAVPIDLVVSGWSFQLQRRIAGEQLQRTTQRLAEGKRHLTFDLAGVGAWVPAQSSIERLSFCWEPGDQAAFVDAVMESVSKGDLYDLGAAASGNLPLWHSPDTFLEARRLLLQMLRSSDSSAEEIRNATAAYGKQLQRDLIDPMMEAGIQSANRIKGSLRMEFANLSALLHTDAPFLQHDLLEACSRTDSATTHEALDRRVRRHMFVVDRQLRLARGLR